MRLSAANLNGSGPVQIFKLTVIPTAGAPIVLLPRTIYVRENETFSYQIEALGMPAIKPWPAGTGIFAEGLPAGMSLQTSTGTLSGVPRGNSYTYYSFQLYAINNGVRGKSAWFSIYKNDTPNSYTPIITGPKSLNVKSGLNLALTIKTNITCFEHSFNLNSTSSYSSSPTLTSPSASLPRPGISTYYLAATARYRVSIFGSRYNYYSGNASGLLRVDPANGAPAITSSDFIIGRAGTALTGAVTASASPTDFEADFSGNAPPGVIFSSNGQFSGTPTTPGNYSFLARAKNASGWSLPKFTTLSILPATLPPQSFGFNPLGFGNPPPATPYKVGTPLSYTPSAPFAANYFVITGLPAGLGYNETTGVISGTPEQPGSFMVKLRPFSDTIIGAEIEIPFTIQPADGSPVMSTSIVVPGTVGQELAHTLTATASPLGFNVRELPDFVIIDPTTGAVTGIPSAPGNFEFIASAFNELGDGMPVTVKLAIAPAAGTPVTSLSSQLGTLQVGVPFSKQLQATPSASFFDSGSLPYGIDLDPTTGIISGTPLEAGTFSVPVWGVNEVGQGAALSIAFVIAPNNGTPVISNPSTIRVLAGSPINVQFSAAPSAINYTLSPMPPGLSFHAPSGLLTGVLPVGSWTFDVYGTNALGNGPSKTLQLESYSAPSLLWQAENFADGDAELGDWNASPAGDGISNLVKYALGIPVSESSGLPAATIETHNNEKYLVYTIEKNPLATDVQIVPEMSTDLSETNWNSGSEHFTVLENTPSLLKVRDKLPLVDRPKNFIRMRVTLQGAEP